MFRKLRRIITSKTFLASLGILALALLFHHVYLALAIRYELKELKSRGLPASLSDIARGDEAHSCEAFRRALAVMDVDDDRVSSLPYVGEADPPGRSDLLPPDLLSDIGAFLQQNSDTLAALHAASGSAPCYPTFTTAEHDALFQAVLDDFATNIMDATRILHLQTLYQCETGEVEDAVRTLNASLAVSEIRSPFAISFLLATASQSHHRMLETLLSRYSFSAESLKVLQEAYTSAENSGWLEYALATEAIFVSNSIRHPLQDDESLEEPFLIFEWAPLQSAYDGALQSWEWVKDVALRLVGIKAHWRLRCFQLANGAAGILAGADEYPHTEMLTLMSRANEDPLAALSVNEYGDPVFIVFQNSVEVETRRRTAIRIFRVTLALERYRLATNRLPNDLSELAPAYIEELPIDPYTGENFHYRPHDDGYLIYSVYHDLEDDGGYDFEADQRLRGDYGLAIFHGQD